jgi:hypothetical protein
MGDGQYGSAWRMIAICPHDPGPGEIVMAALPPDHATQSLVTNLIVAKAEADRLGARLAASLIGMAILSFSPTYTDGNVDPIARNDNQTLSDRV